MCKLVTVNCLSRYSGCKCILTFTEKNHCHKSGLFTHISPHVKQQGKVQMTDISHYGTLMISWMCLSIDFVFFCYNSEILGWCKTEESVYFGVCCSASIVYSHSLWERTAPTMHCMDHHVSYSLWADGEKKKSAFKFFWFWLIWNILMLTCSCCSMLVIEAQHAFHQQSHCVNYRHEEHCTSVAEGFHRVNMGFLGVQADELLGRRGLSLWSCKGTKTGVIAAVHNVYRISTLFWYPQLRSGCIYITSQMD